VEDENDWVGREKARIASRRTALGVEPPRSGKDPKQKEAAWGLALSGGGIRSATFSLGVLQALAKAQVEAGNGKPASWLRCFDYLSTVSGGGYVGAFFVSLFMPGRLAPGPDRAPWWQPMAQMARSIARALPQEMRGKLGIGQAAQRAEAAPRGKDEPDPYLEAAGRAYEVLQDDPPGRVRSGEPYDWKRRPLAWLRENGRYLTPTGAGDYVYAAGLAIRNWFSLHYVIGTALLLLFALVAWLKSSLAVFQPSLAALPHVPAHFDFFALRAWAIPDPSKWTLWWSPLWVLPLAVLALWLVPSGIAFWLIAGRGGAAEPPDRLRRTLTLAAAMDLALALMLVGAPLALEKFSSALSDEGLLRLKIGSWLLAAVALLGLAFHVAAALIADSIEGQRVEQTRAFASGMKMLLGLIVLAMLDTLSQTFYFWLSHAGSVLWGVLTPSALLGALVWLVQKLATAPGGDARPLLPAWLPRDVVAAAGAVLLLLAVATAWAMLVQWLLWGCNPSQIVNGDVLAAQYPGSLVLVLLALLPTLVNGLFPSFINLSTLQAFYGARITRAYLGASNGARFSGEDGRTYGSAAEPHPKDPIARRDYYDERVLAPLHIINVTMNQTVDPTEQLVQRDRKGKPLAVGPAGLLLDGEFHAHRSGGADYGIGQWIGVSGAAFTTGLGRATTLGLSLLLGLANVRLGAWWRSKLGRDDLGLGLEWLALKVFPTQTYLGYELSGHFYGEHRMRQYLSDGGHFENTAAYELLRPEREVSVVVACDDGCDPGYQFADLANLFRLARIDHQARFELASGFDSKSELAAIFGRDDDFAQKDPRTDRKCALLYRVSYPSGAGRPRWLIVLKPRLIADAPLDVWQYQQGHPSFPQETTTDQFFDEAQWESYRKLGLEIGTLVFGTHGEELLQRLRKGA
jgi:hypothetical protein